MQLGYLSGHVEQPASNGTHRLGVGRRLRVLIVEDDPSIRAASAAIANQIGLDADPVASLAAARFALRQRSVDLVLLDVHLGAENGLALLEELRARSPLPVVVVTTAFATVGSAIAALRAEAFDFLEKPFSVEELMGALEGAAYQAVKNQSKHDGCEQLEGDEQLICGNSPAIQRLRRIVSPVASASHPVLIEGEVGTEKERLARSIHLNGSNAPGPFVSIDCGALPAEELERLLFGTSASNEMSSGCCMCGSLTADSGGTVFLNEIDRLPAILQSALLSALERKVIQSPCCSRIRPVTARIVTASSSQQLYELARRGRFRMDLFLRLNVVKLRIPPLRERKEDIPRLSAVILDRISAKSNCRRRFDRNVVPLLREYEWPGNLTELENAIEYACLVSTVEELHTSDLPEKIQTGTFRTDFSGLDELHRSGDLDGVNQHVAAGVQSIAEIEKSAILNAIKQTNGDKLLAAKVLGIGKTTLYRKLKEYEAAGILT